MTKILNVASAQSKSISDEYLLRQNELESQLNETQELKTNLDIEMKDFVEKSSDVEKILIDLRQKQSKFNEELREYENKKSIVDLDSKSLLEKTTNVRLELKTYEINLENSNKKIVQAGLDIEHINSEDYELSLIHI